jgi:hypothetical protein
MAELLLRGFDAYWADRGNPAFDIACFHPDTNRATRLRVKTSSNGRAVWTVRKSGLFLDLQEEGDLVVIVNLAGGLANRDIYILPTMTLAARLEDDFDHSVSHPGRGGIARKADSKMRCITFSGEERPSDKGYGYDRKFRPYLEAWDLLR